uniref:NADH-ubiquinone oxidoreductase chain 2 n=1 Tax=Nysius fuscovittatus TaxID=881686 RepID=A0A7D5K1U1_9HEMI|nr:NADH dehydrogenase subunit 2 [Nysius fuscovittatus]QLF99812.1 NADH dehydrogenase subunit 2 [Nysius fuscovittatus]
MFNFTQLMFLMMLILSSLITISATSWIGMWMGMEMNLMAFIPLISKSKNKKSSQAMITYFLIQSISSITFLFSVLISKFIMISPNFMNDAANLLLMISLLIKLGAAPFHMWLPEMMTNLNWMEIFILSTWQKMAPMYVLSNIFNSKLIISVMLSAIIGAIGGINTSSMRKIMAYSSINHMSWILIIMMSQSQWYSYLMLYSIMMLIVCSTFYQNNFLFMNQVMNNESTMTKLTISSMMLSMGGMPPFIGFLPKWIALQSMINNQMLIIMIIMIMMSMLTLFYYMRMMSSMMLFYSTSYKWMYKNKNMNNYMLLILNLNLPMFSILSFF